MRCLRPDVSCYCRLVRRFDPGIEFVILIHPLEHRRRIATGRMSHLCLENSHLILGQDYSNNQRVNDLIENPNHHSVILYPSATSCDLDQLTAEKRLILFPKEKKLVVFVIDGTWHTAKKTVRQSRNLASLPRICFTPTEPSKFKIRTQPKLICHS